MKFCQEVKFKNKILKLGDFEGFQLPDLYAWFSVCSQNREE
jgi:hypothetical protein